MCVCFAAGQIMPCASNRRGAVHSALRDLPADKVPITLWSLLTQDDSNSRIHTNRVQLIPHHHISPEIQLSIIHPDTPVSSAACQKDQPTDIISVSILFYLHTVRNEELKCLPQTVLYKLICTWFKSNVIWQVLHYLPTFLYDILTKTSSSRSQPFHCTSIQV